MIIQMAGVNYRVWWKHSPPEWSHGRKLLPRRFQTLIPGNTTCYMQILGENTNAREVKVEFPNGWPLVKKWGRKNSFALLMHLITPRNKKEKEERELVWKQYKEQLPKDFT